MSLQKHALAPDYLYSVLSKDQIPGYFLTLLRKMIDAKLYPRGELEIPLTSPLAHEMIRVEKQCRSDDIVIQPTAASIFEGLFPSQILE